MFNCGSWGRGAPAPRILFIKLKGGHMVRPYNSTLYYKEGEHAGIAPTISPPHISIT